jgi:hypothetical protein
MRAHATGVFTAPPEFRHEAVWVAMQDFKKKLGRMRESHWARAMDFSKSNEAENAADETTLSAFRFDDFYLPSSPTQSDA